jgi:hypothetical protein
MHSGPELSGAVTFLSITLLDVESNLIKTWYISSIVCNVIFDPQLRELNDLRISRREDHRLTVFYVYSFDFHVIFSEKRVHR